MKNRKIKEILTIEEQEKVLLHFIATQQEQHLLKYLRAGFTVTGPVALLICNLSKYEIITPIKNLDDCAKNVFQIYFEDWDNNVIDKCFKNNNFVMAHAINPEETISRLIQKQNWDALRELGEEDKIPNEMI